MDQVYLSPQAELTEFQAELLGTIAEALYPYIEDEHNDFMEYTQNLRPHTMVLGQFLRLDRSLYTLENYRSLILEMVEDFEDLGNYVVQLSETIRALRSIQEQMAYALNSLFEIDMEVFSNPEYSSSLLQKSSQLFERSLPDNDYKQLELQL